MLEIMNLECSSNNQNSSLNTSPLSNLDRMLKISSEYQPSKIDMYFDYFLELQKGISDKVFLKGNVLLNKLLPGKARATKDLDIGICTKEIYDSIIAPRLREFAEVAAANGVISSYDLIETIQDKKTGGVKFRDSNGKITFSVDVSFSMEALFGVIDYNFSGDLIKGSSLERILCDKVIATLSIQKFRRIKDFYDIWIIYSSRLKWDLNLVLENICRSIGISEFLKLLEQIPFDEERMLRLEHAWNKFEIRNSLTGNVVVKPRFVEVYNSVFKLYLELGDLCDV